MSRWGLATRLILTLATLLLVASPLVAQDRRERRPSPQDRQEMERRVRAQMSRMMRAELRLTEAEFEPVATVMERFLEERRDLWRSERALRRDVQALLEDPGLEEGSEADPRESLELLRRMAELRDREAAIFEEEQEALLEILTPTQVLQLHTLRESISRRVRALRGRRGGPGGRGGMALGAAPPWPRLERPAARGVAPVG